ncbi:MAG: hypothetical protein U9P44_01875, partial [archaeon]|nr:hypothetical protein [archaeon]
ERLAKKKNITIKKATQALKERDMLEEKTFCELYNIRFSDRSPYSLIIDTSNIAKEEMKKKCLKTITKTMTRLKKQQNS